MSGRYRLIALLGHGGMGDVYRADDLLLDHPVALKFLQGAATDGQRLAQFHNELRTARQVSHKNVCRLYDLGDADGRRFLTMEYVDGEDLASLLRRIGRIPQDKALEMARQLCAGLAAAHERGVLHRDLKPANVMIDGRGDVRITDFGLAAVAGKPGAVHAGTPQYMAPEQLQGQAASVRSDIYALGLVLFEVFTGRRAFEAKTLHELRELHESRTVTAPTSVVRDLDPAIERIIVRCLQRDPAHRPGSALAVAAALPGGDPLAAALAAGETPSPDMLAAAGETDAMPVAPAVALMTVFVLAVGLFVALAPRSMIAGLVPLEKPPAVLADRAQQIMSTLGYNGDDVDRAYGFGTRSDFPRWIEQTDRSPRRWDALRAGRPAALVFWYRTSPRDLVPAREEGRVSSSDPPEEISGMKTLILDTKGRLEEFRAVPPQFDPGASSATATPSWKPLFDAAGLDLKTFSPVAPDWTPRTYGDTRAAWEGPFGERSDLHVRVEAAAYRGRPTSFLIVGPWTHPTRMQPVARSTRQAALSALNLSVWCLGLLGAALLARRNLRLNRGDRRGAARLALYLMTVVMVGWAIESHHVATPDVELSGFFANLRVAIYFGGTLWVMYLAIEPYARRLWPDALVGWTRLLAGHIYDPRVGRDVLIGCVIGACLCLAELGRALVPSLLGRPAPYPSFGGRVSLLLGGGHVVGQLTDITYGPLESALFIGLLFVALRAVLRRTWAAALVTIVLVVTVSDSGRVLAGEDIVAAAFDVLTDTLVVLALLRGGLLVTTVALIVDNAITNIPIPPHLSDWSAAAGDLAIIMVVGLACFAFYAARAGQPLFGTLLRE